MYAEGWFKACPFGYGERHGIEYNLARDPSEGFLFQNELRIKVGLKEVERTTECKEMTAGKDMRPISYMMIDQNSIAERLETEAFGVGPLVQRRNGLVMANMLIHGLLDLVTVSYLFRI